MKVESIFSFLPRNKLNNSELEIINGRDHKKIVSYTGFDRLHILNSVTSTEDFFFSALKKYFKLSKNNASIFDAIIFSSHSRKLEMPIFSAKIQNRFNFRNNILCYDLPSSCSGFTMGLLQSYSFLKTKIAKNILLICADAHSKNLKKKNLKSIISDGISVIHLRSSINVINYDIGVDGRNNEILRIDPETKSLDMNGIKVLEFALKRVPNSINNIQKQLKKNKVSVDYYALHQPNKTMLEFIVKKLRLETKKVIKCVNFGNTSSPSIPISLCNYFNGNTVNNKNFLFCGFGSGLSWSTILIKLKKTFISKIYFI